MSAEQEVRRRECLPWRGQMGESIQGGTASCLHAPNKDCLGSLELTSRSPSPVARRPQFGRGKKNVDYDVIKAELAKNGFDHIAVDGHVGSVGEEDVERFMVGFKVDKVRRHCALLFLCEACL